MAGEGWVAPGGGRGHEAGADRGPASGGAVASPDQPWPGAYGPASALPPPDRAGVRVLVGLLVAAVLVAAGVVGVAVGLPEADDAPDELAGPASVEPGDIDLVPFRDPEGNYEISVPAEWASASLEGDISRVGDEAFPDDARRADAFEQMASSVPRTVIFASVDPEDIGTDGFASNINIVRLPGAAGADMDRLAAEARTGVRSFGGEVTDEGRFMTAAGEAVRVEYEFRGVPEVAGIQYGVPVDGSIWTLTFTSDELPAAEPLADAVAATFAPEGTG